MIFAKGFLRYQAEQAVYCLAEHRSQSRCRKETERKLRAVLRFGELGDLDLSARRGPRGREDWSVQVEWKIGKVRINVKRELGLQRVIKSRDLRS